MTTLLDTKKARIQAMLADLNVTDKWDESQRVNLGAISRHLLADHSYNHMKRDPDNCGACALNPCDGTSPNYAGWARVYVEAKKPIPADWLIEELTENDNISYLEALAKSVNTFGLQVIG